MSLIIINLTRVELIDNEIEFQLYIIENKALKLTSFVRADNLSIVEFL